jgi:hypothetical protein
MGILKLTNYIKIALMAITMIFFVWLLVKGDEAIIANGLKDGLVGSFLGLSYVVLIVAVVVTLAFALAQMFGNLQAARKTLIGLGVLAVLLVIAYAISSGADYVNYPADFNITEQTSRLSSMGLNAMYFSLVAAVGAVVYAEVMKLLK